MISRNISDSETDDALKAAKKAGSYDNEENEDKQFQEVRLGEEINRDEKDRRELIDNYCFKLIILISGC